MLTSALLDSLQDKEERHVLRLRQTISDFFNTTLDAFTIQAKEHMLRAKGRIEGGVVEGDVDYNNIEEKAAG
jgi:hypothetical protein